MTTDRYTLTTYQSQPLNYFHPADRGNQIKQQFLDEEKENIPPELQLHFKKLVNEIKNQNSTRITCQKSCEALIKASKKLEIKQTKKINSLIEQLKGIAQEDFKACNEKKILQERIPANQASSIEKLNSGTITINDFYIFDIASLMKFLAKKGSKILRLDLLNFPIHLNDDNLEKLITYCPNLRNLKLNATNINDLSASHLAKLKSLESLTMKVCRMINFSFVKNYPELTTLDLRRKGSLSSCLPLDFSDLKDCPKFTTLKLENFYMIGIEHLRKHTQFKTLELSNCMISDVSVLEPFIHLEELRIWNCHQITNLNFLENYKDLKIFELASSVAEVENFNVLNTLSHLKELLLHLFSNPDISLLENNPQIKTICINGEYLRREPL